MKRRELGVAILMAFLGTTAFALSVPAVAFYARSLGVRTSTIGTFMASFFLVRSIASLIAGKTYGKVSLLWLFLIPSLLTPIYMYCTSALEILVLRALQGFFLGFAWTTVQIAVASASREKVRGTVLSAYFTAGSLAIPFANIVYSTIPSLQAAILTSCALFLAVALMSTFLPLKEGKIKRKSGRALKAIIILTFIIKLSTSFVMSDIIYIYLKESITLSPSQASQILGIAYFLALPMSLSLGIISDFFSERAAMMIVSVMSSIGLLFITTKSVPLVTLGISLAAIGWRGLLPVSRRISYSKGSAKGVGYTSMLGDVGTVLSSLLFGVFYDLGAFESCATALALCILSLSVALYRLL